MFGLDIYIYIYVNDTLVLHTKQEALVARVPPPHTAITRANDKPNVAGAEIILVIHPATVAIDAPVHVAICNIHPNLLFNLLRTDSKSISEYKQ